MRPGGPLGVWSWGLDDAGEAESAAGGGGQWSEGSGWVPWQGRIGKGKREVERIAGLVREGHGRPGRKNQRSGLE